MRITGSLLIAMTGLTLWGQPDKSVEYGIKEHAIPQGLLVGDAAAEIDLSDQHGARYVLSEMLEDGPVVLTFYRGNWCPHCSRFLAVLTGALGDIQQSGGQLVAVSPEDETQILRTHENQTEGKITLLHDENAQIMKAYGVAYEVTEEYVEKLDEHMEVNLAEHNNQEQAVLPVAATYVINKDGMIVYRHFDLDYTQRAPIQEILESLKAQN